MENSKTRTFVAFRQNVTVLLSSRCAVGTDTRLLRFARHSPLHLGLLPIRPTRPFRAQFDGRELDANNGVASDYIGFNRSSWSKM